MIPVTVHEVSAQKATIQVRRGAVANLRKGDYGRLVATDSASKLLIPHIPMFVGKPLDVDQRSFVLNLDADPVHFPAISSLMFDDLDLPRRLRAKRQHRRLYIAELFMLFKWAVTCPFTAVLTALSARTERTPRRGAASEPAVTSEKALQLAHQKQD